MEFKKFKSGEEMFDYIIDGNDLFSKSLGIYVFVYNDADALCTYCLSPKEFAKTIKECEEYEEEYWAGMLGWKGSNILDSSDYNDDEHRYHKDWEMRKLYLQPSLDFCEETYMANDWADTKDVTVEYVLSE